ncbi:MAG: PorT family protein [Dysgonamonadaceae bacterium]|nr:PorT family protein [Dysgonamonadaceae bacterium]
MMPLPSSLSPVIISEVPLIIFLLKNSDFNQDCFFSVKGSKIVGFNSGGYVGRSPDDDTYTFNELYLRLPLYITFRKSISSKFNVNIGFGPYFAYGIGGKTKQTLHNSVFSDGSTEKKWDTFENGAYDEARDWLRGETLNPFDFGAGVKVDCGYNKFIWGIGLEAGIIDVMNKKESRDLHYRNENISVSAVYRF